jgi:hypothetical protein
MQWVRVAAAAAVSLAVLAGCSDNGTANETLPTTSTTAAETTETLPPLGPPDLPMPAEAREQTPAGAEAFLNYFIATMNFSLANSTTEFLRDLSPACQTCLQFADGIDDVTNAGQVIEGASFILNGSSEPLLRDATAEFSMSLTQQSSLLRGADGVALPGYEQPEAQYPGSGALLSWNDTRTTWQVTALTFQ